MLDDHSQQQVTAGGSDLGQLIAKITRKIVEDDAYDVDLQQLARSNPEYADELRWLIPSLQRLGRSATVGEMADTSPEAVPRTLGDFRLVRELGRGGMGVVYEAIQTSLDKRVALKILPFASVLDNRSLQRFKNEARAAAQLQHPHIVSVYSVGMEHGVHFYAMQYVDGVDLSKVIRHLRMTQSVSEGDAESTRPHPSDADLMATQPFDLDHVLFPRSKSSSQGQRLETDKRRSDMQGLLSSATSSNSRRFFETVVELSIQSCKALHYAHTMGIVHRDIKPSNLLLDGSGDIWISDFGLAQVEGNAELTVTGDFVGTLRYMSPEQALANRVVVDHRTDIYSMGVTMYELLTLRRAYDGESRETVMRQIAFEDPQRPRKINRRVPTELETIVMKAMSKNPDERYQTAADMADDLQRYREDQPIKARRPGLAQRAVKFARRHRGIVWSVGASLLLLLITSWVSAWLIWQEQQATTAALSSEQQQRKQVQQLLVESEALRLAASSALVRPDNPGWALLLAISAVQQLDDLQCNNALLLALDANHEYKTLASDGTIFGQAVTNQDGSLVMASPVAGGRDATATTARVFDVATGDVLHYLDDGTRISSLALSRDGGRVLTSTHPARWDSSRTLDQRTNDPPCLWDAVTGRKLNVLEDAYLYEAVEAAFDPQGRRVVTGSHGNEAIVWDAIGGHRLLTLQGHTEAVLYAAFSPGGNYIVTISADQSVGIWDAESGDNLCRLRWPQRTPAGSAAHVVAVSFHPQESRLLTGSKEFGTQIWQLASGQPALDTRWADSQSQFDETGKFIVSHSPSGGELEVRDADSGVRLHRLPMAGSITATRLLRGTGIIAAGTRQGPIALWEIATGNKLADLKGHRDEILSLASNGDGRYIVSTSIDSTVRVWYRRSGRERMSLAAEVGNTERPFVAHSSDQTTLFVTTDPQRRTTWLDAASGRRIHQLASRASALAGSGLVALHNENEILLIRDGSTEPVATLAHGEGRLTDALADPEGAWVAGFASRRGAWIWDLGTGRKTSLAHPAAVTAIAVGPENHLATAGSDGNVYLWDPISGSLQATLEHESPIEFLTFNQDATRLASITRHDVTTIWDVATAARLARLEEADGFASRAVFHPLLPTVLTYDPQRTDAVRVWDIESQQLLARFSGATGRVQAAFHPTEPQVAIASDQAATIWDYDTGTSTTILDRPSQDVAFHAAGRQLAVATRVARDIEALQGPGTRVGPPEVLMVDVESGQVTNRLDIGNQEPEYLAFVGDTQTVRFVGKSYGGILTQIGDLSAGISLQGHAGVISFAEFSPDGRQLVTVSRDATAAVWDVANGQRLHWLEGHTAAVTHAAYAPDGGRLVTTSADHTAIQWNLETGQPVQTYAEHSDQVWDVQFSFDGQWLATMSRDGTVVLRSRGQTVTLQEPQPIVAMDFSPTGPGLLVMTGYLAGPEVTQRPANEAAGRIIRMIPRNPLAKPDDFVVKVYQEVGGPAMRLEPTSLIRHAQYSPDGKQILTMASDRVFTWDAQTGRLLATIEADGKPYHHATYSPDQQRVVTLTHTGIIVWRMTDKVFEPALAVENQFAMYSGPFTEPRHPHRPFSHNGNWLLTISQGRVRWWPTDLLGYAVAQAPRVLDPDQRYPVLAPLPSE